MCVHHHKCCSHKTSIAGNTNREGKRGRPGECEADTGSVDKRSPRDFLHPRMRKKKRNSRKIKMMTIFIQNAELAPRPSGLGNEYGGNRETKNSKNETLDTKGQREREGVARNFWNFQSTKTLLKTFLKWISLAVFALSAPVKYNNNQLILNWPSSLLYENHTFKRSWGNLKFVNSSPVCGAACPSDERTAFSLNKPHHWRVIQHSPTVVHEHPQWLPLAFCASITSRIH